MAELRLPPNSRVLEGKVHEDLNCKDAYIIKTQNQAWKFIFSKKPPKILSYTLKINFL